MNTLRDIETQVMEENFIGKGKLKKGFKNLGNKIKEKVENLKETIKEPEWIPLTPFKPVMQKMLKKKGLNSEGSLPDVAKRFLAEIVDKKNYSQENFDTFKAAEIVQKILGFIKKITDKAQKGIDLLTFDEKEVFNDVENRSKTAIDAPDTVFNESTITKELTPTSDEKKQKDSVSGSLELSPITLVAIGAVLYFALKK
jgi:hypothetical protein